jgi:hypothetical protein
MSDPSRDPYSKHETTRRWVKVVVITAIIVALLVLVVVLIGGHTPRRHF